MSLHKLDRRQDQALRAAIDRIRCNADQLTSSHKIYQKTLKELCQITGSPNGFIVEKVNSRILKIVVTHSINNEPSYYNLPFTLDDGAMPLDEVFERRQSQIDCSSSLAAINLDPLGIPLIKQMITMPLLDRKKLYAVICLVNSPTRYNEDLIQRCQPLLITSTCMQRFLRNREPFHIGDHTWCKTLLDVINHSPMSVICINEEHRITKMNMAAEQTFDINAENAIGKYITEFVPERYQNEHRVLTLNPRRIKEAKAIRIPLTGRRRNNSSFPIYLTPIIYREGIQESLLLMITDYSETETFNRQQHDQIQRFKAVSDLAPIGILQTNEKWEAEYINSRWCDICGYGRDQLIGLSWINSIHPDDVSALLEHLREEIIIGNEFCGEYRLLTPIGNTVWVQFQARPLLDHNNHISGFIATIMDMTYRKVTDEKLRRMAENDALTGLTNRALFYDRLEHALHRLERHGPFALLCLDLDGFKNVNDTLGHDAGDLLLIEVSKRLLDCVRSEDTVARFGGDEFMVLIEGLLDASVAANVAEKFLSVLHRPILLGDQEVFISTSIGITFATGHAKCDAKNLIKQADIALYRAKEEGRNNYQYFSPELEEASKSRLELGNSLHRATERHEFQVFYQLQSSIHNNQPVGTEALLRWNHPDRGLLPPTEFIPLLEETSLIGSVSRWLWYQAFSDHKSWIDQSLLTPDAHISINLSPRQLRDTQLVQSLEAAIKDSEIAAEQVVVELTESSLITDSDLTEQLLTDIKSLGVRLALDDFGTGYSSLTYLKRFAIDIIKIDQTFVRDMLTDPEDVAIIQAVLALANSLSITTVAEGVDTDEKLRKLGEWGCQYYQGYLLNRPCDSKLLASILKTGFKSLEESTTF